MESREPTLFSVARSVVRELIGTRPAASYRSDFAHWLARIARDSASRGNLLDVWMRRSEVSRWVFTESFNRVMDAAGADSRLYNCGDCGRAYWWDEGHVVASGDDEVCSICFDNYYVTCHSCTESVRQDDSVYINNYGVICTSCREQGQIDYGWCHECGEAFLSDDMVYDEDSEDSYCQDHAPKEKSMCAPKFLDFEFPALCTPQKSLKADEIITVTQASGDITSQGMRAIAEMIYKRTNGNGQVEGIYLREIEDGVTLDRAWQNKEGNFPKRFAKHLLVNRQMKLTEEMMAEVGNLAKAHTGKGGDHFLSITRDLNQSKTAFVHDGSCWWSEYAYSRCELKAWFGFGVRTFRQESLDRPVTRAWLVPLSVDKTGTFGPTHLLPADAYVLFNSYGMEPLPYARIVAGMTGKSYRRVQFRLADAYINNASGVLIAEQSVCDANAEVSLPRKRTCRTRCA